MVSAARVNDRDLISDVDSFKGDEGVDFGGRIEGDENRTPEQDMQLIKKNLIDLDKLTQKIDEQVKDEEFKEEVEFFGPTSLKWAKEAINICTSHLSEQQKVSLFSEQLTTMTYQPQEATDDEVNFKDQLKQVID
jgi:hypothetical protein